MYKHHANLTKPCKKCTCLVIIISIGEAKLKIDKGLRGKKMFHR